VTAEPELPRIHERSEAFDVRGRELDLLLSEKEQADKQIGSYLELQIKTYAFIFTAATVGAGWMFAQNDGAFASGPMRGVVSLTLAFLISFATLQGVSNYGIVLGYIKYKNLVIGPRMQALLRLRVNPLGALKTIASSRSNRVVVMSSATSGGLLLAGAAGLLVYAGWSWLTSGDLGAFFGVAVLFCTCLWLIATISAIALLRAIAEVFRDSQRGAAE
jgi:hypothetical protein